MEAYFPKTTRVFGSQDSKYKTVIIISRNSAPNDGIIHRIVLERTNKETGEVQATSLTIDPARSSKHDRVISIVATIIEGIADILDLDGIEDDFFKGTLRSDMRMWSVRLEQIVMTSLEEKHIWHSRPDLIQKEEEQCYIQE